MATFTKKALGAFGLGAVVIALVAVGSAACSKGELEKGLSGPVPASSQELMAELQTQKERIDHASDEMMKRIDAFNATRGPGERKIQFSELFYSDLNPEQRDVLDQLLKEEKNPSYKNLLTNIVEDRSKIQSLQDEVMRLEQKLDDKFVVAKKGDTHYDLAHEYLVGAGVSEEKTKELLSQIDLSEDILPGFKIWYNYDPDKDVFKTYVTQGEAGQTPLAVKRAVKRQLIGERDAAVARATALEQTKTELEQDVTDLRGDIRDLEDRRDSLSVEVADLEARNSQLQARTEDLSSDLETRRNSMYYYAGSEKTLAQQGVLTRFLKNLKDVKGVSFDAALDLRQAQSISFTPESFGLKSIRGVQVWPEVYKEGRDYTIQVSEDGASATVKIVDPNIFRQQRVLFSLRGET